MLNYPQDSPPNPNKLDIRSFADHLDQHLNLVPADAASYFPFPPTIFCPDGLHDLLVFPTSSPDVIINGTSTAAATTALPANPDLLPHGDRGAAMAAASTETRFARARASKKDRHSKIFTASGPRDRRMRLSIDVARKFFQLQDMLGFDKASKTVQWLLSMSKGAIKDVAAASSSSTKHCCTSSSNPSPNSTESSTISGSKDNKSSTCTVTASEAGLVRKLTTTATKAKKGSTNYNNPSRNKAENYFHSTLARESRVKARERARERTKEKQRLTSLSSSNSIPFDHDIKQESTTFGDLNSAFQLGDERASCDYPSIGASDLFPVYGNTSNQPGAVDDHAGGVIYQEQWDLEAISFYSRQGLKLGIGINNLVSE